MVDPLEIMAIPSSLPGEGDFSYIFYISSGHFDTVPSRNVSENLLVKLVLFFKHLWSVKSIKSLEDPRDLQLMKKPNFGDDCQTDIYTDRQKDG